MKLIGRLLAWMALGMNAVAAALLLWVAYSPYVNPSVHPVWACAGLVFPAILTVNVLFLVFWLVVRRKYALFPLIVLLCCWSPIRTYIPLHPFADKAPEGAIKVLSYNTRAFGAKQAHTREHPNETLAYLQQSDADIICLQEYIWGGKLKKKDIDYALKDYPYRHYHPLAGGLNGLGCYSRYPILSATPIPYPSRRNGSILYRIRVKDDTLTVVNNHLESYKIQEADVDTYQGMIDAPDRNRLTEGSRKLVKKLAEASAIRGKQADVVAQALAPFREKALVVCGDFNDSPISYTHRVIGEGLDDAFAETGSGAGFTYVQNRLFFRIDHILTGKGLQVYECTVDRRIKGSDHYPIWCYVTFK